MGTADQPAPHRPLLDRYIAAVDAKGAISTGHAALELPPDMYISHYPAVEIDHSPTDFFHLFRATPDNDVPGRFQPSYAVESADGVLPPGTSPSAASIRRGCARSGRPIARTRPTI